MIAEARHYAMAMLWWYRGTVFRSQQFGVLAALVGLAAITAALAPILDEDAIVDVALLYLLLTLAVSALWGWAAGIATALAADLLVNFFFIPPLHTFTVNNPSDVVALLEFLAVAAIGASMFALLRREVAAADARRGEAALLLEISQQLAHAASPRDAMSSLCLTIARSLGARGCSILQPANGWSVAASTGDRTLDRDDIAVATEALRTGEPIRRGESARARRSGGAPKAADGATFVPFRKESRESGVLVIYGPIQPPMLANEDRLLAAFADEAAIALRNARLSDEARRAEVLRREDQLQAALLSSVSHDLRSPLTAIKASVGNLRDRTIAWTDEDAETFLETIESQTDRLTATVGGLLEMSRIEGGVVRPKLEPVLVAGLLNEVVEASATDLSGRPVSVDCDPTLWIRADYTLIMNAVVNIVENAAKYSTPGGAIVLSARPDRYTVHIEVRDVGPGIPPDDLPHVFEKFYRGPATREARGTGLGLSIVDALVKLSGGTVKATSSETGATFAIELPVALAPASTQ